MFSKTHLKKSAVGLFMAATCMSMSVMPALAADETITTTGDATAPANASIGLSVDKASEFTISVPKKVEISTGTKDATVNYDVKVTGDIPSDSYVTVVPTSDTITLSDVYY